MKRRIPLSTLVALLLLLGATAMAVWPKGAEQARPADYTLRQVRVDRVRSGIAERTARFPAVVQTSGRAALAFAIPGRLASRSSEVGQSIRAGQPLAELDAREYRLAESAAAAARAEVEARFVQSERDRARVEALFAGKAATSEEREQINTAHAALAAARDAAIARHEDARRLLSEATLRAPFNGSVTAVHMEPGEWIPPGRPVVEVAGGETFEAEIELPESVIDRVQPAAAVSVRLPHSGREVGGRLLRLASNAPGPGRLFQATIAFDRDAGLSAGQAVEVLLPLQQSDGVEVPLSAVLNPGASRPAVFRVDDGVARRLIVELGPMQGEWVAVRGDLSPGDSVVTAGHTALMDGDRVEVR